MQLTILYLVYILDNIEEFAKAIVGSLLCL